MYHKGVCGNIHANKRFIVNATSRQIKSYTHNYEKLLNSHQVSITNISDTNLKIYTYIYIYIYTYVIIF